MSRSSAARSRRTHGWWAAIGAAVVVAAPASALAAELPAGCKLRQLAVLPVTMVGTRPTVEIEVNGKQGRMVLDTGAFFSMLTPQAAKSFGLHPAAEERVRLTGVGGLAAKTESVTVKEFTLSGLALPRMEFLVADMGSEAVAGLLGENILGGLDMEYDLANGVAGIFRSEKCGSTALAYWAKNGFSELDLLDGPPNSRKIYAYGSVNGQRIRLQLDSGASRSVLTLQAAARAGVTPKTPGVVYGGQENGIGTNRPDSWIAPFDSFKIAGEEVQHTKLRIGNVQLDDSDMLLGADFFLSHRIFVSRQQRKIYFTYNGGQVFQLESGVRIGAAVTDKPEPKPVETAAAEGQPAPQDINTPTDAAGFVRRGSAFMGRLDFPRAIDDFTRANALDPKEPSYLYQRGRARMANRQPILAMSDFDEALKLKPDDVQTLIARAALYNASGDKVHARADLDSAVRAKPADPETALQLAVTYEQFGFLVEALAAYDRWVAGNTGNPAMAGVLNNRCYTRAKLKTDLDKALADCNASLKLNPRNTNAFDSRGLVHLQRGELAAAVTDYDAVLKLRPKAALALYGRGLAKQRQGMNEAGEADIAAAIILAPRIADQGKAVGMTP